MNKIMFNDKYGLTKAVLEGRKTQTRRIITCPREFKGQYVAGFNVYKRVSDGYISEICMYDADERAFEGGQIVPKYRVGEIVAVAQSYKVVSDNISETPSKEMAEFYCKIMKTCYPKEEIHRDTEDIAGWTNKMFVKAELMPHQIRITNVRIERLNDISDNDCLAEGVEKIISEDGTPRYYVKDWKGDTMLATYTPQNAYSFLIDKVSGKGTWESNPYVFVYDFELIK